MKKSIRQYPLPSFFLLAFAGFWGFLALDRVPQLHFWAPFLGVFAPAVAALFVTGMCTGETGIRQLSRKLWIWRVRPYWYAVAVALPIAQAVIAIAFAAVFHKYKGVSIESTRAVLPTTWIFFLFASGEELGWRGYALPRLLTRYCPVTASLILGALHSIWHWPLILPPHALMSDLPLLPWTVAVLADALVFTWILQATDGSVLLPVLFHGTVNASMLLFNAIDAAWMPWIKSGLCVVTSVVVLLYTGPALGRKQSLAKMAASP